MHLIVKNVGTDLRPEFAVMDCEGRRVSNVVGVDIECGEDGTFARVVLDLMPDDDLSSFVPDDEPEWRGPTNRVGRALELASQN